MLPVVHINSRNALWIVALIVIATLLPFLGETMFNSKGEPREAIVAVSMLNSGDWILPVSNGDVIPYKPPFMAWCIALFSLLAGHVTEYTSRLPSALALIVLVLWSYRFFARNYSWSRAFLCSVVTLTAFEVYRAGFACRVDMLLTMFIVGALYSLYGYWQNGFRRFPWLAVLMMSGAMLTKGPVGVLLPCAVAGVFMLLQGVNFGKAFIKLLLPALAALALPAVWYVAAYRQGGDEFLRLAMEENFGRFTGTMSYDSHVKPVWYNFITVITGYVPYTLLILLSLIPWGRINALDGLRRSRVSRLWSDFKAMEPARKFALVSIVVIFVFYCIPKSKRSVYLLPIYPFIALFIADYITYLAQRGHRALKIYAGVMASIALVASLVFLVIQCGWFPYGVLKGRHALDNAMMITGLEQHASLAKWLLVELSAIAGIVVLWRLRRQSAISSALMAMGVTVSIYWAFAGVYQPAILNAKSDKPVAEVINRLQPEGDVYAHVSTDMLRFFTANYYTGDRIKPFESAEPSSGYLLIGVEDARTFLPEHADDYDFYMVRHVRKRSCDTRQPMLLLKFREK